jgi:hypothetical protein
VTLSVWSVLIPPGATSGFPLLNLLTATNGDTSPDPDQNPIPTDAYPSNPAIARRQSVTTPDHKISPAGSTPSLHTRHADSPHERIVNESLNRKGQGRSPSTQRSATSPDTRKKEKFFPDRTPRPSQTLNPEASWKVITGVIPPDLMDTLVRCYVSLV